MHHPSPFLVSHNDFQKNKLATAHTINDVILISILIISFHKEFHLPLSLEAKFFDGIQRTVKILKKPSFTDFADSRFFNEIFRRY